MSSEAWKSRVRTEDLAQLHQTVGAQQRIPSRVSSSRSSAGSVRSSAAGSIAGSIAGSVAGSVASSTRSSHRAKKWIMGLPPVPQPIGSTVHEATRSRRGSSTASSVFSSTTASISHCSPSTLGVSAAGLSAIDNRLGSVEKCLQDDRREREMVRKDLLELKQLLLAQHAARESGPPAAVGKAAGSIKRKPLL
jgi:hypothetical protein